jgi:hypothetical protein
LLLTEILTAISLIETPEELLNQTIIELVIQSGILVPILEELIFRLIFFGEIYWFIIKIASWRNHSLKEYSYSIKMLFLGNKFPNTTDSNKRIRIFEGLLLLLNALGFAIYHIYGWGIWKFFPVIIMGLLLGIVFLRYGLLASILIHIENNLLLIVIGLALEDLYLIRTLLIPLVTIIVLYFFERFTRITTDHLT